MNLTDMLAILYGFIACIATTIGIIIIWKHREWGKRNLDYFLCFAAGLVITVAMLHIIPKSFEMNVSAPIFLVIGFFSLHMFDRWLEGYIAGADKHDRESAERYALGLIAAWGIGVHSFIDGIVYMVTFSVSMFTGIAASTAMVFHEIPEGIITWLLLKEAGLSEKKSLIYAFLAAALSTPLGAIVAYPFISRLGELQLGMLLGISAGALVYVGASRLLPEGEKGLKKHSLLALAIGMLTAIIIIMGHEVV